MGAWGGAAPLTHEKRQKGTPESLMSKLGQDQAIASRILSTSGKKGEKELAGSQARG